MLKTIGEASDYPVVLRVDRADLHSLVQALRTCWRQPTQLYQPSRSSKTDTAEPLIHLPR
jgi:hypothetical protein